MYGILLVHLNDHIGGVQLKQTHIPVLLKREGRCVHMPSVLVLVMMIIIILTLVSLSVSISLRNDMTSRSNSNYEAINFYYETINTPSEFTTNGCADSEIEGIGLIVCLIQWKGAP